MSSPKGGWSSRGWAKDLALFPTAHGKCDHGSTPPTLVRRIS